MKISNNLALCLFIGIGILDYLYHSCVSGILGVSINALSGNTLNDQNMKEASKLEMELASAVELY